MDLAISVFSGRTMTQLATAGGRSEAKAELIARVKLVSLPEGKLSHEAEVKENLKVSGGKVKETSELTAAQAIKRAHDLTVQPEIYDIYFTEFVMM
jgi:flagellar basal body-associated protein FliL